MADFTALRGIVCPVVSPCTSNEGVDYDSLQENLARLLRAPITGFYVCGGTGDGSRLTFDERRRTAELTITQTKAAGRQTLVHVGQTLQRQALELMPTGIALYALEEDLQARALSVPARAQAIDYPAFVELCGRYAKVNSWL